MIRYATIEGDGHLCYQVVVHGNYSRGFRGDATDPPEPNQYEISAVFLQCVVSAGSVVHIRDQPNIMGLLSERQLDQLEDDILESINPTE